MNSDNRDKTLPKIVDDFIGCIVKKVGRSKKVRREVGQELTDHFTDALHEFQTETERQQVAEHLISQFGDRIINGNTPVDDIASKYRSNFDELIIGLIAPQPFQNKIFGRLLIRQFLPAVQTVFVVIKRENTQYEVIKLGFALRIYQLENGKYPEKLDNLPTKLLREYDISLTDPFSGKQYKYFRTAKGFKIYSYGMNYVDDGGKDKGKPDIVLEVPFVTPEK